MICTRCNKRECRTGKVCEACRAKEWREKNPEKRRAYAKMRYLRDREKIIKATKEWAKKNKKRYMERKAIYRKEKHDYDLMCAMTRYRFRDCKKLCADCGITKQLQFHHPEPLSFDNFIVLCKDCHRKVHGRFAHKTTSLKNKENQHTKSAESTNKEKDGK